MSDAPNDDIVVRLDRIYTRGGDLGETSLGDGHRVGHLHLRARPAQVRVHVKPEVGERVVVERDVQARVEPRLHADRVFGLRVRRHLNLDAPVHRREQRVRDRG